jgi:peroxiredoxin
LPAALLVALAELGIAAALVPGVTARPALAAAAALLAVFTAAIGVALLRGRTPDCHCFGQLHSAPAGPATLARNAALAGLAVLLALQPASDPTWLELAAAAIAVVVVAQALLSYTLLRRYGRALRRIEALETGTQPVALEVGAAAPDFALPAVDGGKVTLADLLGRRGRPVLLVFTDPNCGPCHALIPKIADWQRSLVDRLTVAVVSRGDREDNVAIAREHGLSDVLLEEGWEVSQPYGATATPSAVLISADGRLVRAPVAGGDAIEQVLRSLAPVEEETRREQAPRPHRKLAAAAAVAGGLAAAASANASPQARSQQPANPELEAIKAALKAGGPRLVAASQRSFEAVRAQAPLNGGAALRAKQRAARNALAAERREILALRATVARLPGASREAHNAKVMLNDSLSLLAQSLTKRRQALAVAPKASLPLLDDAQQLAVRSLVPAYHVHTLLDRD